MKKVLTPKKKVVLASQRPVPVVRERSKEELMIFLQTLLETYDEYLLITSTKPVAKKKVLENYDDLGAWLYYHHDWAHEW